MKLPTDLLRKLLSHGRPAPVPIAETDFTGADVGTLEHPPTFVVGTGRCGTKFYYKLLSQHSDVRSLHEAMASQAMDAFGSYCLWNGLEVDTSPVIAYRRGLALKAKKEGKIFFESNAYLSLFADKLYEQLDARVVLAVREPLAAVRSICRKGWYAAAYHREALHVAAGFQPHHGLPHHFFGRLVPNGDEFERWQRLTRVGKVAWFWNMLNCAVLDRMQGFSESRKLVLRLERFDFAKYEALCDLAGTAARLERRAFDGMMNGAARQGARYEDGWTQREREEFLAETVEARRRLGYENVLL